MNNTTIPATDTSTTRHQRFPLGQLVATRGALAAFERTQQTPIAFLSRHATGDWGDLDSEDKALNDHAVDTGGRLLSAYHLTDGTKIWVITEADRDVTSILKPEEY